MTTVKNSAAWLTAAKTLPLEVKPAESYKPEANQILVNNKAVGINPVDGLLAKYAYFPLQYPTILGEDVAGEVVAVGPGVTDFKVGDRVAGQALGLATHQHANSAFQSYVILYTSTATHIPSSLSFEQATVFPLVLSTAACALYEPGYLELDLPTTPHAKPNGQTVLIYGGSSGVGLNAIQLAVASGYEVVTTSSAKNFDLVKSQGASQVLDHTKPSITQDLIAALKGKKVAGAVDAIGGPGWAITTDVIAASEGKKFVSTTKQGFKDLVAGVDIKQVMATHVNDFPFGRAVYRDFVEKALEAGTFKAVPEAKVVGHGLGDIGKGIDIYDNGNFSAQKAVVTL